MNADLLDDLAEYINVLAASLNSTKHPQDRSAYERHYKPQIVRSNYPPRLRGSRHNSGEGRSQDRAAASAKN